ncbi:MAG: hypothetical protein IPK85_13895 [Gemmatimonadetes bacterium]|nr:hypothetical protein [Gemmatimonadota bacterium]
MCDRNWAAPVDGDWNDRFAWIPSAIPTAGTTVCFVDPGSYTVTLPDSATVRGILLTSGVNVAFTSPGADLIVGGSVEVRAGAGVVLRDEIHLAADSVVVDGELRLKGRSGLNDIGVLHNRGLLELDANVPWDPTLEVVHFLNDGEISLSRETLTYIDALFEHRDGTIRGNRLLLREAYGSDSGRFVWTNGALEPQQGVPVVVESNRLTLVLASSGHSGAVTMIVTGDSLIGNVGLGLDLTVKSIALYDSFWHLPAANAPPNTPVVIEGTLRFEADEPFGIANELDYVSPNPIINRGRLELLGRAEQWYLVPHTPALDNHGTLTGTGSSRAYLRLSAPAPSVFRNYGTVDSLLITYLYDGEYVALAGSRQQGRLYMFGGALRGGGYVRSVSAFGGTIAPGTALGEQLPIPLVASLQIDSLWLQSGSAVVADVVSQRVTDQIVVGAYVEYRGTITARPASTYLASAGTCGQLVPIFLTSGVPSSGIVYPGTTSLPVAAGRAWRVHHAADTTWLAGYNPDASLDLAPNVAVTEGGSAKTVDACLGIPVRTNDVLATLVSSGGDVSVTPSALSFTAADFALPRRVTLTAVDDALSEGPHTDSIVPIVTAGGPPLGPLARTTLVSITDNDPGVDLTVLMVSLNNPVVAGTQFEKRFRVTNLGPGASTGSVVSFPGMAGATFAANRSGADCSVVGTQLQCNVGPIASGGSYEFLMLFNATAVGVHQNTMRVRGLDWDHVPANDHVPWVLTVQ